MITSHTQGLLWELIEPSGTNYTSLDLLALRNGYLSQPAARGYCIGVNASNWLRVACRTCLALHGDEDSHLRLLFGRLSKLLSKLANVVFVFDGKVAESAALPQDISDVFADMIHRFGFHTHTAPGEAEAELAALNAAGEIDAVFTNDCRALLFGAVTIIKPLNIFSVTNMMLYKSDQVFKHCRMNRGGMLLIVLMSRIPFIRNEVAAPKTNFAIAQAMSHYGFGDRLLHAIEDFGNNIPSDFIFDWCEEILDYLRRDTLGYIGGSYSVPASTLPISFPDLREACSLVRPVTSPPDLLFGHNWRLQMPDVHGLFQFCLDRFASPTGNLVFELGKTDIWTSVLFRAVLLEAALHDVFEVPVMTGGYRRTDLNIEVKDFHGVGGEWFLQIKVTGGLTNVATTLAPTPPFVILQVPAALAIRAQPQCIQQLYTAVQRSRLSGSSLTILPRIYSGHAATPDIGTSSHSNSSRDQHCADTPVIVASNAVIDLTVDDNSKDVPIDLTLDESDSDSI